MNTYSTRFEVPQQRRLLCGAMLCAAIAALTACAATATREATPPETTAADVVATDVAPEPIRQDLEFTLDPGQPVRVDNPYGSVYLRFGGYEHQLGLHTTLQQPPDAADIDFHPGKGADGFLIAPRLPEGRMLTRGQRFDIVVYVPRRHALSARTRDGVIESRGLMSDLDLRSESGAISVRGGEGTLQAESSEGNIEAAFAGRAPAGTTQRLQTRTGTIVIGVGDGLDAEVALATSAPFTTDYSIAVTRHDGEEPNKSAMASIGRPDATRPARIELHSLRGEIRLLRRAVYVEATPVATPAPSG